MRRSMMGEKKLQLFTKRFFPAGTYTWVVPRGCTSVDVFLVGGGGGGSLAAGGGGGYTKTFKKDLIGWRDGDAVSVIPGQEIEIIVGKGGSGTNSVVNYPPGNNGGYSQFMNVKYRANGGLTGNGSYYANGGYGGSGGGCYGIAEKGEYPTNGGTDGSDAMSTNSYSGGIGQGHTTREFGEDSGSLYAGGGGGGGASGSSIGPADNGDGVIGQGGRGGHTGRFNSESGKDGTVLIRYWAYEE